MHICNTFAYDGGWVSTPGIAQTPVVAAARREGTTTHRFIFEAIAEKAAARIRDIIQAFDVLQSNPLIGRPAPGNKRELIIGRRARGHVALYRYVPEIDTVFSESMTASILAYFSHRRACRLEP